MEMSFFNSTVIAGREEEGVSGLGLGKGERREGDMAHCGL